MDCGDDGTVDRVRAGDIEAFSVLVRRYQGPIYRFLLRFLRSPQDAEDVAQEVFLAAYRGVSGLRRGACFRSWLYRIASRRAQDHVRARHAAKRYPSSSDGYEDDRSVVEPEGLADSNPGPEEVLLRREEVRAVVHVLEELPEPYRAVIYLRYVEEMGVDEIARSLGIGRRTVETRLYRGKQHLRQQLERVGWRVEG